MANMKKLTKKEKNLIKSNIHIANIIVGKLVKSYNWIPQEDLYEYALFGLVNCVKGFDKKKKDHFGKFASVKGFYRAIDEMRKDGVIIRKSQKHLPEIIPFSKQYADTDNVEKWNIDLKDDYTKRTIEQIDIKDLCDYMLGQLEQEERFIIEGIFLQQMTAEKIAKLKDVSAGYISRQKRKTILKLQDLALSL